MLVLFCIQNPLQFVESILDHMNLRIHAIEAELKEADGTEPRLNADFSTNVWEGTLGKKKHEVILSDEEMITNDLIRYQMLAVWRDRNPDQMVHKRSFDSWGP